MGSVGGRERYGVVGREAAVVVDAVAAMVDSFDPDVVGGRDAIDLVAELSRLEHLASGALMLMARRVAQTDLWKRSGHQTPAHWLSHVTGVSVGEAIGLLETAEVVESAPDTREALKAGKVSGRQAKAIGKAENADPGAARQLLDEAATRSTKETERDANRVVAAASTETPDEKAARHRAARRFRHGVTDDGMGWGSWLLPIAEHTKAVAAVEGEQAAVFDQARVAGVRESTEAYAADALCRVLERASARGLIGSDDGSIDDDWSFTKVIVKIDLAALDRGHTLPGEVSEIAGQGPVPVRDVWRMIDGDAFIAAVATKGTEISKVVHLGRRPTVLQKAALDALTDGVCQIDGCNSKARLEIDHVADWAATKRTELNELARPCGYHHDLKTHHGYTFGPLMPNGKRQLIPPRNATGPPGNGEQPALVVHDGQPPPDPGPGPGTGDSPPPTATRPRPEPAQPTPTAPTTPTSVEARARASADRARVQRPLFDTG
jgi:hypothetical protein